MSRIEIEIDDTMADRLGAFKIAYDQIATREWGRNPDVNEVLDLARFLLGDD